MLRCFSLLRKWRPDKVIREEDGGTGMGGREEEVDRGLCEITRGVLCKIKEGSWIFFWWSVERNAQVGA